MEWSEEVSCTTPSSRKRNSTEVRDGLNAVCVTRVGSGGATDVQRLPERLLEHCQAS